MFQVVIRTHFDAAHFLRNYEGKCARLHGHRWDVEVCIEGSELDSTGMLVDFGEVKQAAHKTLAKFDHELLNNLAAFAEGGLNPTAENLAWYLFKEVEQGLTLRSNQALSWVKVYESPDSWAMYSKK